MIVPEIKGIFSQLVIGAQEVGERPTAAFPSSHVGMSTITMMLAWGIPNMKGRWLFWLMMPLYLLLCCATVYIKAHYLVDSIAGLITAVLLYYLTSWLYGKVKTPLRLKD
jgi:membrane-associated phospholipid phosphatase